MATTRPGRLVHLDQRRHAELSEVGRAEHDTYVVTEAHDGTLVLTPAPGWTDDHLELLERPDVVEQLERDPSQLVEAPIHPTARTAAYRLARLALRQAGYWGDAPLDIDVAHPRFGEAVEAAAAAGDRDRALEAATAILQGPEAAAAFGLKP